MAFKLFSKPKPKSAKKAHRPKPKKHAPKKAKPIKKVKHVKKVQKKAVKKVVKVKPKPVVVKKPAAVTPKIKLPEIEKFADEKAFDLLKSAKMPVLKAVFLKKEKDLALLEKLGFPCMMKVSSTKIIHKSDVGGVIKINSMVEAPVAFKKLMKIKHAQCVMAQEFKDGVSLIVGSKYDSHFSQIVSVGLGGIYVEILKDVKFRICPVSAADAEAMVKELKGYEILNGARGQKPIKFDALYNLISRMCNFAIKNKIKEMDINPLFCDEKGCYIADFRIIK